MTITLAALAAAILLAGGSRPVTASNSRATRRGSRRLRSGLAPNELAWLPLVLDLVAAGLMAGQPLDIALDGAAPTRLPVLGEQLRQVAAMLRLGATAAQSWALIEVEPRLQPIAQAAIRSAASGTRLAASFTELAVQLRADAHATGRARAQRAGSWVVAPLGLCFLPAFVCLGIVPVVIAIAMSLAAVH
jgi:pilus assembly protein TadC